MVRSAASIPRSVGRPSRSSGPGASTRWPTCRPNTRVPSTPLPTAGSSKHRPGYAAFSERKLRATSPALYAAMAPVFLDTEDRLDRLRTLPRSLPTLVMVGEQDSPLVGSAERMAEAIPAGCLAVVPDAGHSPQFENPDAWWDALSTFLRGVAPAAGRPRPPVGGSG